MHQYTKGNQTETEATEIQGGIFYVDSLPPLSYCMSLIPPHRADEQPKHRIWRMHNKDKSISLTLHGQFEADK